MSTPKERENFAEWLLFASDKARRRMLDNAMHDPMLLVDLVDPTCTVVGTVHHEKERIDNHKLSCGHWIASDCSVVGEYCRECGCRIVEEEA